MNHTSALNKMVNFSKRSTKSSLRSAFDFCLASGLKVDLDETCTHLFANEPQGQRGKVGLACVAKA